ncbi:MAG: hypothetical protein ACRC2K_04155 [Clostridium sp.]
MSKSIFSVNEMVTIIMGLIEDIEMEEKYGVISDEFNFPHGIMVKLNSLGSEDYEYLIDALLEIAREGYELKSGELNQLNNIHREVSSLAELRLGEYII